MSPLIILQLPAHLLRVVSAQHVTTETPLPCQVFLYLFLVERDALGLKARDAVKPPQEQRHPFGQRELQVPLRLEALKHAVSVLLPVFFLLHSGDNRSGRADAMLRCVPFHHLLAFLGCRSSFGQTQTIRSTRRTHATPPLIRICSIASSPARVQPSSATRKAAGSFANPAPCIRLSHTSCAERVTASFSVAERSA